MKAVQPPAKGPRSSRRLRASSPEENRIFAVFPFRERGGGRRREEERAALIHPNVKFVASLDVVDCLEATINRPLLFEERWGGLYIYLFIGIWNDGMKRLFWGWEIFKHDSFFFFLKINIEYCIQSTENLSMDAIEVWNQVLFETERLLIQNFFYMKKN